MGREREKAPVASLRNLALTIMEQKGQGTSQRLGGVRYRRLEKKTGQRHPISFNPPHHQLQQNRVVIACDHHSKTERFFTAPIKSQGADLSILKLLEELVFPEISIKSWECSTVILRICSADRLNPSEPLQHSPTGCTLHISHLGRLLKI